jgi:hypothetical protein
LPPDKAREATKTPWGLSETVPSDGSLRRRTFMTYAFPFLVSPFLITQNRHKRLDIGMARTCENMTELRDKMNALGGKYPVQVRMHLPLPSSPDEPLQAQGLAVTI